MSVSWPHVGPSLRFSSLCGHFQGHYFISQVESRFSSYDVCPRDWLLVHVATTFVYLISSAIELHYFKFVFPSLLSTFHCHPYNFVIIP
jgi:hypothetical protein